MSEPSVTVRWHVLGWPRVPQGFESRRKAEQVAAEVGGTVQRITTTVEDEPGLRWAHQSCPYPCDHWALYDGEDFEGKVNTDAEGDKWYCHNWAGEQYAGPFATLEEAKAAAEEAVKARWT